MQFHLSSQCLEAGKLELWDLEIGENISSTRNTNDDAVTCVKVDHDVMNCSVGDLGKIKVW